MENATKALIIAASILLAILIISLSLYIYNTAKESSDVNATIAQMDLMEFNKQYELYGGIKGGRAVKTLLDLAAQNNQDLYERADTIDYCVCIRSNVDSIINSFSHNSEMVRGLNGLREYGVRYPSNIREIEDCISSTTKYNIWFSYNDAGYIWEINIDKVGT